VHGCVRRVAGMHCGGARFPGRLVRWRLAAGRAGNRCHDRGWEVRCL